MFRMAVLSSFNSLRQLLLFPFILLLGVGLVDASRHGTHGHRSHDLLHEHAHLHRRGNASSSEQLVNQGLVVLRDINKARLDNPTLNRNEFRLEPQVSSLAPPLNYTNATVLDRRSTNTTRSNRAKSYTIPSELADAAREVAESKRQESNGNHREIAALIKQKFGLKNNDTNIPKPLQKPEGLLGAFGDSPETELASRQSTPFWMTDHAKRGASPLAPSGYRVWRNVKDFGAKGDGVADDTAAINRAISEGSRCGPDCLSGTILPAVVFFPSGTYLVSGSIVQFHNTQLLGDPRDSPTILAASSFVGLGVITSDAYVSDDEEWYLQQNNYLGAIRNFIIDITLADPFSSICGIHWQVAHATSVENIEIYMVYESDEPNNNQHGIYMENGSGGFLADLTFVGGHIGAYFGNQQFTTSHLVFTKSVIAVQVHWDWAWTMQDFVIDDCEQGLVITASAGQEDDKSVGSLILVDSAIYNTPKGIVTSLVSENSTSLVLQNVGFFNVGSAILDTSRQQPLVAGGSQVVLDSWGYGVLTNTTSGRSFFSSGARLPLMKRNDSMVGDSYHNMAPSLFTRRRPRYSDVLASAIMNVKALGAKGDGVTDDTAAINSILTGAANTSSVVYFPYGIYLVRNTIKIPVGSRIVGQAWAQIMGTGGTFAREAEPKPVVQVGLKGDVGIIEIQDMMFTVKGATLGAIVVEWNVRETSQGSVGLWDSHVRVGGAKGTDLSAANCPKSNTGTVNVRCKAASLLMHLTPGSSAYLENVWLWTADRDLDSENQDQISVYSGRGLLVESDTTWLWATSVEHNALYQYQISNAKNLVLGMPHAESPYYQPGPKAPQPFVTGWFSEDPTFADCAGSARPAQCAMSWGMRIIDSSSVSVLGAGIYSWFNSYDSTCVESDNCQTRGLQVEEATDTWIFNLNTKGLEEMASAVGSTPMFARDHAKGFTASLMAFLNGAQDTGGKREFQGYRLWTTRTLESMGIDMPDTCKTALTELIRCDNVTKEFQAGGIQGWPGPVSITDSICDEGCGQNLTSWFNNVDRACDGVRVFDMVPMLLGGRIWNGYNQTCLKDPETDKYCGEIINDFELVSSIEEMPREEMCSYCWLERFAIMQRSPYSGYDAWIKSQLEYSYQECGKTGDTSIPPPPIDPPTEDNFCVSSRTITTEEGDTCDSIASAYGLSSASLYASNPAGIMDCSRIRAGTKICLPPSCGVTYALQTGDTCLSIERNVSEATGQYMIGSIRKYNRWVDSACGNLHIASASLGHILCMVPPNGYHHGNSSGDHTTPKPNLGYANRITPPPANAIIAEGTTRNCGIWYVATEEDACNSIVFQHSTTIDIFMAVNPSLGTSIPDCAENVVPGLTYCAKPFVAWNSTGVMQFQADVSN